MHRRVFLSQVLPAVAGAAVLGRADDAHAATSGLVVTKLTDQLSLISGGGGNVTVFTTPEGVLLVDGGAAKHSARILAEVRKLSGARGVHTLFNTHWHHDQTGSNLTLGNAGTRIIAHENTKLWLGTEVNSKWESRVYERLPPKARPTQTFYTTGSLEFGGEQIDYGLLPNAHTDGDIFVRFRKANVLVAGDVVTADAFPVADYCTHGWIGGTITATQMLFDITDEGTRLVPGRGATLTRAQVKEENEMLQVVRGRMARMLGLGMSAQEMVDAAPAKEFEAQRGDPTLFIRNTWEAISRRPQEMGVNVV
jgi:cyclase